jgi:hypothetical protein
MSTVQRKIKNDSHFFFALLPQKVFASFSIGVTTGNTFAGAVGNENRCEYAMIGVSS